VCPEKTGHPWPGSDNTIQTADVQLIGQQANESAENIEVIDRPLKIRMTKFE
jgi:hypothetical protein